MACAETKQLPHTPEYLRKLTIEPTLRGQLRARRRRMIAVPRATR